MFSCREFDDVAQNRKISRGKSPTIVIVVQPCLNNILVEMPPFILINKRRRFVNRTRVS